MTTKTIIEVRYRDCDMMKVAHHSIYAVWLEVARMDFFKAVGFSFADMNALDINPVMVDLHMQFKAPAKYPGTLTINTSMGAYAARKLQLIYEVYNESGELINTAETFHVWVGPGGGAYNMEENLPDVYARIAAAAN